VSKLVCRRGIDTIRSKDPTLAAVPGLTPPGFIMSTPPGAHEEYVKPGAIRGANATGPHDCAARLGF
jgi:hypothetical protein